MPMYSFLCECGNEFTAFQPMAQHANSQCPRCSRIAPQILSKPPAVHGFRYGYFEHIAQEPVYAKSKRHLRELCAQHDCYAKVLD